jgi:deazaflavin-dependent oxidoreductase (nitroreductase family)
MTDSASIRYADASLAWLTTTGRRTGLPRTVELWFVLLNGSVYFLAGGGERADWVRNARAQPRVSVRLGSTDLPGTARTPEPGSDEDRAARQSMAAKYQGWREGRPLSRWAATSTCLAVDLDS